MNEEAIATPFRLEDAGLLRISDVASRVLNLACGERLTLVGIAAEEVRHLLRANRQDHRSALLLEESGSRSVDAILDGVLDDLAAVALARFPHWYGHANATVEKLITFARSNGRVSGPWIRAAAKRSAAGHSPRFRKAAKHFEFTQLMQAIDTCDPVLIAAIDPMLPDRAAPTIAVVEWCARQGASVAAIFPVPPPLFAPYDRLLYGALKVVREMAPAPTRFIAARTRAHHASAIEQRVEAALRRDLELSPLFSCNETVPIDGFGPQPRVDLLWREGRVVVELDGPEHQGDPNFANDRHRDYELLISGYFVLRITNDQVETDLQHAIEKIRAVVRFRRSLGMGQ
jgi:very-short-patch-repair endonuclease